jgi:hypothetical protein
MSLADLLPNIRSLSRVEKLHLIQLIAHELAEGEADPCIPPNRSYPVWSPDQAFPAAEALLQALSAEKGQP